jgi:transposase
MWAPSGEGSAGAGALNPYWDMGEVETMEDDTNTNDDTNTDVPPLDTMEESSEQEQSREERAFTLYCQGMRVTEIALTLAASETTIRRWLRARLETLAQEERAERAEQLLRAIESQRAIASAAWRAYERERAAEEPDRHEGARYLSIALSAQREVARLQGLYYRIGREPAPVSITLTRRPDTPESPDAPETPESQSSDEPA